MSRAKANTWLQHHVYDSARTPVISINAHYEHSDKSDVQRACWALSPWLKVFVPQQTLLFSRLWIALIVFWLNRDQCHKSQAKGSVVSIAHWERLLSNRRVYVLWYSRPCCFHLHPEIQIKFQQQHSVNYITAVIRLSTHWQTFLVS